MSLVSTLCTLTGRRELMSARLRKHAGKTARVQLAKKKHQDCSSIKITPSVREKKAWYPIACVTSVSVRFRSKEWRTRVKGRAKNGASKTATGKGWVMVRNLGSISAHFPEQRLVIEPRSKPQFPFHGLFLLRNQTETPAPPFYNSGPWVRVCFISRTTARRPAVVPFVNSWCHF